MGMGAEAEGPAERPTVEGEGASGSAPRGRFLRSLFSRCSLSAPRKANVAVEVRPSSGVVDSPPASNEPRRQILEAALFFVSFFTAITILLIYMENTAMGQQQFRQNMRQESELANIAQDNEKLVAYMRQWILISAAQPFPPHARHTHPSIEEKLEPTYVETCVAQKLNYKRDGVFVELGAYGSAVKGESHTEWLEKTLGWRGLLVTPDAHDYFRLRARRKEPNTLTAQACLSTSVHPKEITYQESGFQDEVGVVGIGVGSAGEEFSARVKCFPLYSFLLASQHQHIDFLSISCGGCELTAFMNLPHDGKIHISIIEIAGKQADGIEELLTARGYIVTKKTESSVIYMLRDLPTLKI